MSSRGRIRNTAETIAEVRSHLNKKIKMKYIFISLQYLCYRLRSGGQLNTFWAKIAKKRARALPERVLNTMAEARTPSTRRLSEWSIFSAWCQDRDLDLVTSDLSVVLSFLQGMLDKQRSSSTIKVHTATIAAFHALLLANRWAKMR